MKYLTILLLLIPLKLLAPQVEATWIERPMPDNGFEPLVKAVLQVECDGDHTQFNLKEEATGPLQIRAIRLRDYNNRTGNNYKLYECFDYELSRQIFLFYANRIGYPEFEKIAKRWNGSGKLTINYWQKVKRYL
jgi:hypothetical protein